MEDLFEMLDISDELKDELHATFDDLAEKARYNADAIADLTVQLDESNKRANETSAALEEANAKLDAIDLEALITEKTERLSTNERANVIALFDLVESKTAQVLDTIVASISSELTESVTTAQIEVDASENLLY